MYTITGYRTINYENQQGHKVDGIEFYLVDNEESNDEAVVGSPCLTFYCKREAIKGTPEVGAQADLSYTIMRGTPRITGINIL